jgi:hypothetical protein
VEILAVWSALRGRGPRLSCRASLRREQAIVLLDPADLVGLGNAEGLGGFMRQLKEVRCGIPDDALRLGGDYVDLANDWAYRIPIVEHADSPVHIPEPLYLHEPSGTGKDAGRAAREAVIARPVERKERRP